MKDEKKNNILIILGRYLPGYKGGGPGRSIANLVDVLGEEYNFYISCYDRDLGDSKQYSNIQVSEWNRLGAAMVYYVPEGKYTFSCLKKLVQNSDIIYVCGCFDSYAIKILLMSKIGCIKKPIVIASMGLFSPLAFKIKYYKKESFVMLCNILGIFSGIHWSTTSELEIAEVKGKVKSNADFFIAQDIPRKVHKKYVKKRVSENLKIVFISRISQKKNLLYAIKVLQNISSEINIEFTVYGPIEDKEYWGKCELELSKLPKNVLCNYKGSVESEEVIDVLRGEDVFLFPTLGENYGHVIQEALSAGCVCVLSDQTPWNDLELYEVGNSLSLDNFNEFVKLVELYAKMNSKVFQSLSDKAVDYAFMKSNKYDYADGYRNMFNTILRDNQL